MTWPAYCRPTITTHYNHIKLATEMNSSYVQLYNNNKKLSYPRDSARRRPLRHSRSFKVTHVGIKARTRLPDSGWYWHLISRRFPVIEQYWSITFDRSTSFNTFILCNLYENHKNHVLPKPRFFGLHSCCRQCGHGFNQFDAVGFKS